MAQLVVRNLDPEIVRRLRVRAASAGRSGEEEHRRILEAVLAPDRSNFWAEADRLRAETRGRKNSDSGELIREMRDQRARGE